MKKILSFLFCASVMILIAPRSTFAQSDSTKCFVLQGTSDFSFGDIDQETPVEHTFIFKNTCNWTINIDNAKASCGCTAAVVSEKVIEPGKEAKIQVKFTPPKGTRGSVSKTVSVFLKGQSQPHTVLRFSANVKTDLDLQPGNVQPPSMEVGKEAISKVAVKNVTTNEIEIFETPISLTIFADTAGKGATVQIPLPLAKASIEKSKLKPNESTTLTISFTPTHKGNVNGMVHLKTKKNEAQVQIFGTVAAPGGVKAETIENLPVKAVPTPSNQSTIQGKTTKIPAPVKAK